MSVTHDWQVLNGVATITVTMLLCCVLRGFFVPPCVYICELWGGIYSITEECVGHSSEWGRGDRPQEVSRERGIQAAGLCLSVQNRGPTVLD